MHALETRQITYIPDNLFIAKRHIYDCSLSWNGFHFTWKPSLSHIHHTLQVIMIQYLTSGYIALGYVNEIILWTAWTKLHLLIATCWTRVNLRLAKTFCFDTTSNEFVVGWIQHGWEDGIISSKANTENIFHICSANRSMLLEESKKAGVECWLLNILLPLLMGSTRRHQIHTHAYVREHIQTVELCWTMWEVEIADPTLIIL